MTTFASGQWSGESTEKAARVIAELLYDREWDDLEGHELSLCRRTAGTVLMAATRAVQKNDAERAERGLPVRTGFVTVSRG